MITILTYSALYLIVFFCTDILYHKLHVKVEITRKIVHILTGFIALSFPFFLENFYEVSILCLSFLVLLFLSERFSWFKSITAVERKTYGSWLFAIAVLLSFFTFSITKKLEFYYLPLLILSICDPIAALIGKKVKFVEFIIFNQKKSIGGSIAFFISACLVTFIYFSIGNQEYPFLIILLISLISSLTEAISTKGWDNLSIPISVLAILYVYQNYA